MLLACVFDLVSFFALATRKLKAEAGSPPATSVQDFVACLLGSNLVLGFRSLPFSPVPSVSLLSPDILNFDVILPNICAFFFCTRLKILSESKWEIYTQNRQNSTDIDGVKT